MVLVWVLSATYGCLQFLFPGFALLHMVCGFKVACKVAESVDMVGCGFDLFVVLV